MDRLLSLQSTSLEHERRLGCVERSASSIVSGMAALASSSSSLDRLESRVEQVDRSTAAAVASCLRETEQLRGAQRALDESVRGAWSMTCSIREELASDDIRAEGLDERLVSLERDPRPGDTAARVSAIEDDNRAIAQEQSTLAIEVAWLANSCADVARPQTVYIDSFQAQLDRCAPPPRVFSPPPTTPRTTRPCTEPMLRCAGLRRLTRRLAALATPLCPRAPRRRQTQSPFTRPPSPRRASKVNRLISAILLPHGIPQALSQRDSATGVLARGVALRLPEGCTSSTVPSSPARVSWLSRRLSRLSQP
jgi:hypothetical protein